MHRFRKKSDAKRSQLSSPLEGQNLNFDTQHESLPELPPANDFRTSLILPDLSRRFSLLRSSTGDPVSLEHLRTRLADQRARGEQNQISEEEEDMLLETLGRLRSRPTPSPGTSQEHVVESEDSTRNSVRSTGTSTSSTSSPSGRSTKRYSNNLFGSGRLRGEYNYLRSVASSKGSSSSTRTVSLTPTEASIATTREASSTASLRPVTPESSNPSSSVPSSPNENDLVVRTAPLVPPVPFGDNTAQAISTAEYRLHKTLGPTVLKRASMALEQAIKEIEDEVEDEILLPRSVPVPRGSLDQPMPEVRNSHASNSSLYEAGMAISIDQTIHDEFSERRQSPVPARTVPGYVPGMPRPMTPRDFDFDEQRSHSTTPRAQSPLYDPPASPSVNNISTTKLRRESTSSTARPSPITPVAAAPLFLQRGTNGRYTPDDGFRSGGGSADSSVDFDSPLGLSILGRRRPASPLSGPPYQPMAVTNAANRPSSRPSTPSNVIWTPNPNNNSLHKSSHSGHSRNNSWTTDGGVSTNSDYHGSMGGHNSGQNKPGTRSLRSPALPDSPTLEFAEGVPFSFASAGSPPASNGQSTESSEQPHAYIPAVELGSPLLGPSPPPRSATPTQTAQRSPISPTFSNFDLSPKNGSRRSSRQNPPSSPFNTSSFPPLGFSPRANSSRSSLNSVGSSFHSWDEPDKVLSAFSDTKEQRPAWHEFERDRDQTSSVTPGSNGSPDEEEWDAEEIIQRYAGLKKGDIVAVQDKLIAAAFAKIANTDPRDRAPSSLRRRRPSTSQSNYSRIASPPPQLQPPASPSPYVADDQYSALLNSVVDSIKEQPPALNTNAAVPTSADDKELSPNTRRNRDLAHVLFGAEEENKEDTPEEEPSPERQPVFTNPNTTTLTSPIIPPAPAPPTSPITTEPTPTPTTPSFTSPYLLLRNPSTPRIPPTPQEQAELTREVQQKTDAAMIALNKDPSRTNLGDSLKHVTSVRRRVDPSQISTPKLVSTTTSVETVSLPSPSLSSNNNSPGASKLGSRFKKLRGSLRAKNLVPTGEETVTLESVKTPPPTQTAYYDPTKLNPPGAPKLSSATEAGRFKVPIPSPPASAGPGLKGFMARFRNKQRLAEMPAVGERSSSMPRATSPLSPLSPTSPPLTPRLPEPSPATPKPPASPMDRSHNLTPRQPGQPRPMYSRFPPANPPVSPTPPPQIQAPPAEPLDASQSAAALEQLFRAANNLGLDENALNDLLARSGSTSSRNLVSRNTTTAAPASNPAPWLDAANAQQVTYVGSTGSDQTATPTNYENTSQEQPPKSDGRPITPDDPDETVTRKPSTRKADHLRRPKAGQVDNAANTILRRTIIYANDVTPADFSALVQRKNSARRKRASATSMSSRSVHDRAPTPPPPKSPTVKRFSADGLPPMPQMPNFLGQADKMLNVPSTSAPGPIEKSNSTYESLYDMYDGESRAASADPSASAEHHLAGPSEPGPALEVIQLANGETIWNIVNGLRDGDDESIYSGRTSFASEYSNREPGTDGLQSFMKDHTRSGSKGSVSSFVSKKKPQQGKTRPETKVFYSSSAQIGRLIESLSQGADAGSFNFLPNVSNRGPGHSASSSVSTNDINWTVEERLDRMLGAMNAS